MQALAPYPRTFSRRKLDFEQRKCVQATKRSRVASSSETLVAEPAKFFSEDGVVTQKDGLSTYRRRRFRRACEQDVKAVKNKRASTSSKVRERDLVPAKKSSDVFSPEFSPLETLISDSQDVSRSNGNISAISHGKLGSDMKKALHSVCDRQTHDSRAAELPLSVMDVSDMGSLLPRVDTAILYEGPYPSFTRPSPEECSEVYGRLSLLHGPLEEFAQHKVARVSNDKVLMLEYHKEEGTGTVDTSSGALAAVLPSPGRRVRSTVLDSLVGTILSQNTTDKNSQRAFSSLKTKFPTWESVFNADPKAVEEAIRCGGLAEIKASRILNILRILYQERGKLCLEYVREMSTDEVKLELSRFKGVGPKTIACVLMFHLQQNEFPVDTHVFRITKMLGWVPANADREKAYLHLNHRIPDHLKFDLHCLLVTHGKRCPRCAKGGRTQRPADGPCPLVNLKQTLMKVSQRDSIQEA